VGWRILLLALVAEGMVGGDVGLPIVAKGVAVLIFLGAEGAVTGKSMVVILLVLRVIWVFVLVMRVGYR
jgi:hypothetical protein